MSDTPHSEYRDHDHRAEDAVIDYIEDPTPENAYAAELAVAKLQRAYEHVLRRLDGDGALPPFPVRRHNPATDGETADAPETRVGDVDELRRELSAARSWAWAEHHRVWVYPWFPHSWRPRRADDDWHLPHWLTSSREPHRQDWWTPPGVVLHTGLESLADTEEGEVRLPSGVDLNPGAVVYLTDAAVVLEAEAVEVHGDTVRVRVRWRGDRE
jgi:hypothetical protein